MTKNGYYNPETAHYLDPKTDRRVVLITGGNSGIGWYTVLHLYMHGYVVYVGGRNESKCLKAIEDIKIEARKRRASQDKEQTTRQYLGEINYIYMDLMDLSTVDQAIASFSQKEPKLHILINNAGIMAVPYEKTKDDFEIQYQVNFVSHFLLSLKLIPNLRLGRKEDGVQPRIVFLTSLGHNLSLKYYDPSVSTNITPSFAYSWVRYGIAKTASIQAMIKLASEASDILCLSVHPGVIYGTELYNYWKDLPFIGQVTKLGMRMTDKLIGVSVEEGSLATLRASLDDSLTSENDSGKYLVTGGAEGKVSRVASNQQNIDRTWNWNIEELTKRGFYVPE